MMKSLGEILKKQMKQTTGWKQLEASVIVEKANETLQEIFGLESKKFAQAIYFKDRTISITCLSSVMAQEIRLNEKNFLSVLNTKLGAQTVEKIRYLA
ncbi:MAG TPA: DciA family protein [Candidatus Udaeobacter sp.]|nr:DciA family protein [Candidatus Udaeobacter sp.]